MNSLEYLLSFQRFGIKLGLDNITYLLGRLGNPHLAFPAIHITGTNGKGSVTAFISTVLEKMGYRVGRYISPHLIDFSERIAVNGMQITASEIDALVDELRPIVDEMQKKSGLSHPTFFEAVTAMAFQYFAQKKIDFGVIEVGMGGRFDSTNVVRACLSIITNVHLEHREYLGDTIEKIAVEKAGIIKDGVEVVSSADRAEARAIIDGKAGECGSPVFYLDRDFRASYRQDVFPRQYVTFTGPWSRLAEVEINLAGEFQAANAAVALMGLEILQEKGLIPANERALREGMASARWPARLEKVSERPFILLDGAHNPSAMRALTNAVRLLFPERRIILVLGMLSDKDVGECLQILRTISSVIVVTQPVYERALAAEKLFAAARTCFSKPLLEPSLPAAVQKAVSLSNSKDIILVCGSLFNVAEVKNFISGQLAESARRT